MAFVSMYVHTDVIKFLTLLSCFLSLINIFKFEELMKFEIFSPLLPLSKEKILLNEAGFFINFFEYVIKI